jgi:hypothetical protein
LVRRFHVGFAERAEELGEEAGYHLSKGAACFEGQCAARIREKSMIDHALTQMDSDNDDMTDDETMTLWLLMMKLGILSY